ncbi:hypothetical protein K493DRAFT_311840 [Basidiobolus meristosporus CBS 931.73]|uniref:Translation initiation factor IF-3 n=1 Tax=Basidiobolus meristosporus CBS 931.73 TaxID=1314790 RepID=A0A1Y1YYS5_9FUNG|nr:hypothetical protein K493DRAFT_311840 [Basidiobolus meristosporus CBS 931.73]|eukprot:ORY03096.1 hypothetical protein K493DRAFT_311840 [Basidiobolus meristosporus CBS 931.73]
MNIAPLLRVLGTKPYVLASFSRPLCNSAVRSPRGLPAGIPVFSRNLSSVSPTLAPKENRPRRDEEIDSNFIQFIDETGKMQGIVTKEQALQGIDRESYFLVEVDPTSKPPICRIVSKKQLYEKKKEAKLKSKTSPEAVLKEVQIGASVSIHDLEHKLKKASEILEKGNRLQVVISNKGSLRNDRDHKSELITGIIDSLEEHGTLVKGPVNHGRNTLMIFHKKSDKKKPTENH